MTPPASVQLKPQHRGRLAGGGSLEQAGAFKLPGPGQAPAAPAWLAQLNDDLSAATLSAAPTFDEPTAPAAAIPTATPVPLPGRATLPVAPALVAPLQQERRAWTQGARLALAVLVLPLGLLVWHVVGSNGGPEGATAPKAQVEPGAEVGSTSLPIVPTAWVPDPAEAARRLATMLQSQGAAVRLDVAGADRIVHAQLPAQLPPERLAEVQRAIGPDLLTVAPGKALVVRFAQQAR